MARRTTLLAVVLVACLATLAQADSCTTTEDIYGVICSTCTSPPSFRCIGCDKVESLPPLQYDKCFVCGGDGQACAGCGGVNSNNYDKCGICNGPNSCNVNATLTAPTFSPADYSTNNNFLTAATTITVTAPAGSTVYYSLQNNTGTSNADLAPPNAFSPVFPAGGLVISTNCTIKVFAFKAGTAQSYVTTAVYRFTTASGSPDDNNGLLIPIWAICVIAVGGALLVSVITFVICYVRVKRRRAQIAINLDAMDKEVKLGHFRVLYEYHPQNDDELELKVGDIIAIDLKYEDGWWKGRSYRLKHKEGLVPGSYLQEVPPERLMWSERPKTVFGRMSQRMSTFFGGAEYGTDPQTYQGSGGFSKRMSQFVGLSKPPPTSALPSRPNRVSVAVQPGANYGRYNA